MADIIDVANALVAAVRQAVYPNGTAQPPIAGSLVHVYPGWPIPANLDADLKAGNVNVSVFPTGTEENVTRFPGFWQVVAPPVTTLTVTFTDLQATLSGTIATPQNVALIANGNAYAYAVQPTDTLTSIATALAGMIAADHPGVVNSGAVITTPTGVRLTAGHVGGVAGAAREVRRQKKTFVITVWAPSQTIRDALGATIDVALAQILWLSMVDGSAGRLIYASTFLSDSASKVGAFRRDITYTVEYPTLQSQSIPTITAMTQNLSGGVDTTYPVIASVSE